MILYTYYTIENFSCLWDGNILYIATTIFVVLVTSSTVAAFHQPAPHQRPCRTSTLYHTAYTTHFQRATCPQCNPRGNPRGGPLRVAMYYADLYTLACLARGMKPNAAARHPVPDEHLRRLPMWRASIQVRPKTSSMLASPGAHGAEGHWDLQANRGLLRLEASGSPVGTRW